MRIFEQKRVLVTGGTGSLGQALVSRMLSGQLGRPSKVIIFSRDEAKQHTMRLAFMGRRISTEDFVYAGSPHLLTFHIGDVRDYSALADAIQDVDIVIHAAALKQVPACEYFPFEAVQTNVLGAQNLVRAVLNSRSRVETVVAISTDKACKPVNVMGMTKALMERIIVEANLAQSGTRFVCVRYGNVISSRGSVVPLFLDQIARGGPVTITLKEMTRFLLTLDQAVDTVCAAIHSAQPGDTYVPRVPSARLVDLARALIGNRDVPMAYTGIRPGEKVHETLVSEEECYRTIERDGYYVIRPILPELRGAPDEPIGLSGEYSSAQVTLDVAGLCGLLAPELRRAGAPS